MRLFSAIIATCLIVAPAQAADKSALCEGWSGSWRATDNAERQADGSWKTDNSDPDWRVQPLAKGKCSILGVSDGSRFDVDTSSGDYIFTNWKDGKAQPSQSYRFVRSEIEGPRIWSVEVIGQRTSGDKNFGRLTMTMAGDSFVIIRATAPTEAGPFRMLSYTAHHRSP